MAAKVMGGQKIKDFKGTSFKTLKDFKPYVWYFVVVIISAIISAVITVFTPLVLQKVIAQENLTQNMFQIVDGILKIQWNVFFVQFGSLLALYVGAAIFNWLSEFLAVSLSAKYAYDMRNKILLKLDVLPLSYFDRVPYGDTLSVGTNDVDNISRNLQTVITQLFSGVTLFIGSFIAMLVTDWKIALVACISLPFTILIVFVITKISGKQFRIYRSKLGELNGQIEENFAGFKIIKLFNKEEDVINTFQEINEDMRKSDHISQLMSGLIFPCVNFINNCCYVGVAVVAGLVSNTATMIVFFIFLNLFTRPFMQIGQIANVIQSVIASSERIYSLLDEEESLPDAEGAIEDESNIKGEFDFNNVYFQYVKEKPLIEDFTLHINAGDTVAIVGPTGAGKTTLVNLIMRFYEITNVLNYEDLVNKQEKLINEISNIYKVSSDEFAFTYLDENLTLEENIAITIKNISSYLEYLEEKYSENTTLDDKKYLNTLKNSLCNLFNTGVIKLDGIPTNKYARKTLRGSVGMVLQETWLFKGTIKENLLFGDPEATDQEIQEACKEAHIDHYIETLPGGYDFVLNEDGSNISQGQRQLLTIARAIISKPKIMILDEATSSVDTRTEQQIQDTLDKIMVGRTSFVIAHRLSTIKNAKLIIVMKKGHIVETGNHKVLLEKGGFYADLYNAQFSGNNPMAREEILES